MLRNVYIVTLRVSLNLINEVILINYGIGYVLSLDYIIEFGLNLTLTI